MGKKGALFGADRLTSIIAVDALFRLRLSSSSRSPSPSIALSRSPSPSIVRRGLTSGRKEEEEGRVRKRRKKEAVEADIWDPMSYSRNGEVGELAIWVFGESNLTILLEMLLPTSIREIG
ncbi:hypothetical protein OsI_37470 [Oryza sativa Indica Group]|uniref:Uncharacterized protein n=1 Tax=Oryza sativa subsp. indica TaxID=39946 RepID=B8BM25_ORYSI|nr:hypothetical protein OsI_37470 [Oryza sativa Indica Group]